MSAAAAPLHGLRILTIEAFGAAPFASMYLANLGAEVIKIENRAQGGDPSRSMGPHLLGEGDSQYFQTFNLNKKSCTVDLKHALGQQILHRLAGSADAIMNNLRGDQPQKLGLTYDALKAVNPRIVCLHISAYGRDNERSAFPGYDYLMQAEAGFMHLTGEPDTPPARMGLSMVDFMTGLTGALALVSVLLGAKRTGRGSDVDVSLFDVALHQLSYPGTWFINERVKSERLPRSAHPSATPVQLFKAADGWIFVMCMTEKFWHALLDLLGRSDLGRDPRFATADDRRNHREALTEILDGEFERERTEHWLARLRGHVPIAPVYDIEQALDNAFVAQVGMIQSTPHSRRSGPSDARESDQGGRRAAAGNSRPGVG